jgi:DNA-binding beta-propeller fold protein YncE
VNEYAQLSNYAIASCSTGLHNEGIAIDKNGDVFVSATDFNSSFTTAHIIEYKGGLSGCNGTTLGVALIYAGGLQIDKSGNLVAVDQSVGSVAAVDIIPPPYNSISYQILQNQNCGGAGIALNPRQNKLFVANPGCTVSIFTYPGGRLVRTLGPSYGFTSPVGVAVFP